MSQIINGARLIPCLALVCHIFTSVKLSAQETEHSIIADTLHEVTVTGQSARQRISNVRLGAENIELSRLAQVPMLFGENDLIKSITLMAGVHSEGDGAGGFEVRGGTASQNLIMLDGITLYNPSHVMGIFSTFNDNALSRAVLYKGPIPAFYGGASSSTLDTSLSAGDMESYHGSATIGILAAKIKAEGPIVKDKLSFAVTARRSYLDMFLQMIPQYRNTVMNFYDVTAKLRYIPRAGDMINVSFMISQDNMAIQNVMGMYWGNTGASVNWHTRRGDHWRFSTTAAFTHYSPKMVMSMMRTDQMLREYIHDYSINERAMFTVDDHHSIELGIRSQLLRVKSAEFEINGHRQTDIRSGWQNALWINYNGSFSDRISAEAGIRVSLFSAMTGNRFHEFDAPDEQTPAYNKHTYCDPEPRISLKYTIDNTNNIKAGISTTTQNLHAVRANTTSFPFDRYAISSDIVRPEQSTQYGLGYTGATDNEDYDWSAEIYYKDMRNVYDYRDGYGMFSGTNIENLILGGKGRSYGVELMLRKNTGRLTGWISYTVSRTQTKIDGINNGCWYNANNDRRHDLSVTSIFMLTNRWNISGIWTYSSGQPLTAPDVKYELNGTTCYYYSQRNGYKTPPTHRLDISANYTNRGKRFTYQWSVGVYNLYCRYNPYVIYFEDDNTKPSGTRAVQQSLFGLIPTVSYTIKF